MEELLQSYMHYLITDDPKIQQPSHAFKIDCSDIGNSRSFRQALIEVKKSFSKLELIFAQTCCLMVTEFLNQYVVKKAKIESPSSYSNDQGEVVDLMAAGLCFPEEGNLNNFKIVEVRCADYPCNLPFMILCYFDNKYTGIGISLHFEVQTCTIDGKHDL